MPDSALIVRLAPLCLITLGVTTGCPNPALPEGAQISCTSDAGCPPGTICGGPLERCVADVGDEDPPGFEVVPEVTPKAGRKDTPFNLTIVADERLGRPPAVVARGGGLDGANAIALRPFELESDDQGDDGDRRTYRFSYSAAGNEPEGVAVIGVELVDESGKVAQLTADSFELDFDAPKVLNPTLIDGRLAGANALIIISLTFSEPLSLGDEAIVLFPSVIPEPEDLFFVPRSPPLDEQTEEFEYRVTGSETEGLRAVHASLVDRVGNDSFGFQGSGGGAAELPIIVTFDFTPPQAGNSSMDTTPHGADELITSSIDFNEVLRTEVFVGGEIGFDGAPAVRAFLRGGDPAIDFVFLDITHTRVNGDDGVEATRLIIQHRVRDCELEGNYDIILDDVVDIAGNEADNVTGPWGFQLADVRCK